ncbi:MAG TPA: HlyD family efflux transporter periplasmic adaptor subunit [Gemmatimonadaceae bacterium]|nr:HlyD family efflux transporter periplasmic adaptor subunit [Gemmatimonadaceae bacterium]
MPHRSARAAAVLLLLAISSACRRDEQPDAYGNFEATEIVVSAETGGRLLWMGAREGQRLSAGALAAVVDTTQLALERRQIVAQRAASGSRASEAGEQLDVLRVQHEIARRAYERTRRLVAEQAATTRELDQAERDYRVLGQQIEAAAAQRRTVGEDVSSSDARVALIGDRITRSRVTNPAAGTVLVTYADPGEVVQAGQPLYKLADLDSLVLRAYVSETQLAGVRLGQPAQVTLDVGQDRRTTLAGTVTWIASEAEFTPTPIQTREERAALVYAVKIRVPNRGGVAKIGMPADVRFVRPAARS